ncbi:MAG TPA: LamG domain-containing protein [Polyangiaceae bacterium]|nr:LamG domain-containing protein [Polyangiaceae bacterium]
MGGATGAIIATTLTGQGYVALSNGAFVNLPNGLLSESNDRTLETWIVWNGGAAQQRIFDFGSSTEGEGVRGNGQSFLSLSPDVGWGVVSIAYSLTGISGLTFLRGASALPTGRLTHLAVVIDSQTDKLALYVDGQLDASATMTLRLSQINDVNDWLGISQIATVPNLDARIHELRIYGTALSDELLALSFELGPDTNDLGG